MMLQAARHPKLGRLRAALGLGRREAVGTLELLWLWTMDLSPAGDVGRFTDEEIAAAVDWHGDAESLIAGLVWSGWLDRCSDHRLLVHDWADHAPNFLKRRAKDSRNVFEFATLVALSSTSVDAGVTSVDEPSTSVGIEQGRKEQGRKEQPTKAAPRKRAAVCVCPDELTDEQKNALVSSPSLKGFTKAQFAWAWQAVCDWAQGSGKKRADWVKVTRGAMNAGWALKGFSERHPGGTPQKIRQDAVEDVWARKEREHREQYGTPEVTH